MWVDAKSSACQVQRHCQSRLPQSQARGTTTQPHHNTTPTRLTRPHDNMADQIKQTKNAINAKRQAIAEEEGLRAGWAESVSCAPPGCRIDLANIA